MERLCKLLSNLIIISRSLKQIKCSPFEESGSALAAHMELNPKSTESIIEVNLFGKLNYNKLPHLLLNSNCGNWKTVYIYKKNIGGGNRRRSPSTTPHNYFLPLNMTFELRHKTVTMQWRV